MIGLSSYAPVSYTHLDVYKRQVLCCAVQEIYIESRCVGYLIDRWDNLFEWSDSMEVPTVSVKAVSYTHLDVYKRQV